MKADIPTDENGEIVLDSKCHIDGVPVRVIWSFEVMIEEADGSISEGFGASPDEAWQAALAERKGMSGT